MISLRTRFDALKKLLASERCTHIFVTETIDIEYLTGFHSSSCALLISRKDNFLFTDFRYKEAAEHFAKKNTLWSVVITAERKFEFLGPCLKKGSVVGFQSDALSVDRFADLQRAGKGVRFVKLSSQISDLSIQKGAAEIAAMKAAAHIGDRAFEAILGHLKPGVTEIEIARTLERYCSEMGSQKPSFDTIVLFGARSSQPHGTPGATRLKKGDWVLFDFGCTVNHFCSDMTRTVVAGKAGSQQKKLYSIVFEAQSKARDGAHAGIISAELDALARRSIAQNGYGEEFGHALGHGIGIRVHEEPRVSQYVRVPLPESAVVTIEPGVYIPGFGGVRIEDMVVLKKTGAMVLTHAPRELIEVPL